jgi:glycosyltransferase involved in cell wall biosynthesis
LISDSEGLPLSAVEAMSAGLPVVLSNVGGCVDLVDKNGVLVENSIEDIKRGLSEVIDNFESFSKKSIELYEKDYNLLRSKDIYINYYNSFIR